MLCMPFSSGPPPERDARFWDRRAPSFAKAASETAYADRFLAVMRPEPRWTVLDVGSGSGTLAIPLAKSVSAVTALDLSGEMLAILRARCEDEGIRNVTAIQGRWEDDWQGLGIGMFDVAVASRSMVAEDLRASVLKLDMVARSRVYIITIVGDGPFDRHLFDAVGRPLNMGPDYIYNYNMLYEMGIFANVAFIDETRNSTYGSPEEAYAAVQWMFDGLNADEEGRLQTYVERNLVFRSGRWGFPHEKAVLWAVMWWEKK